MVAVAVRSLLQGLFVAVLLAFLLAYDGCAGHSIGRAGRVRRRLSWSDWSVRDMIPGYARAAKAAKAAKAVADGGDTYRDGIVFELYSRENPLEAEVIDIYDFDKPKLQHFNPRRPTKVLTHGWLSDGLGAHQIKDGYVATTDANLIVVNWTNIDTLFYPAARWHVPHIGQRVAYLLDFLRLVYEVPASSVHLIGHSLGAHISGMAGTLVQWGKVGRITGLDPAGPMFPTDPEQRLDRSDATFVDVIHTCANVLGFKDPIGHVDFFPNGGTCIQPGCTFLDMTRGTCSHNRAFDFMAESILKPDSFRGFPCSGINGKPDLSDPSKAVLMGAAVPHNTTGTYCLRTSDTSPFALPDDQQLKASVLRHNVGSSGGSGESDESDDNEVGDNDGEQDRDEDAVRASTILKRFMRRGVYYRLEALGRSMPDD